MAIRKQDNTATLTLDDSHPMTFNFPTYCDWWNKNCSLGADCINITNSTSSDNATSISVSEPECKCKDGYIDESPDPNYAPGRICVAEASLTDPVSCKGTWVNGSCMSDGVRK